MLRADMFKVSLRVLTAALLILPSQAAMAQAVPPSPAPVAQPANAAAPAVQLISQGQLDALMAPVALYPDALLSELLMAST